MKWYDKIDWEPVLWFCLSAAFIMIGFLLFVVFTNAPKDHPLLAGIATLFSALGGAGIARVRSSRAREVEYASGQEPIYVDRQDP